MLGCVPDQFRRFVSEVFDPIGSGMLPITLFASGLQASPNDIYAVGESNTWSVGAQSLTPQLSGDACRWRPIGDRVLGLLADHANAQRRVFLDSGAFSAFTTSQRHAVPMPLVPWHDVVKVYSNLLLDVDISNRSHLYLVAPDVIGDRDATHQLWESYRLRLEHLAARGAHVIFPLQRSSHGLLGSLIEDASSSWRLAQSIAGHRAVAGIPYSKRAWSLDEVQDLFRSIRIPKAHLLGVGAPAKINAIYGFLSQSLSDDHFPDLSADAAVIRSMVGTQAHPTPVRKRIAVRTYTIASESVFHDEGEEAIFDQLQASQAKARREILAEALSLPLGTYADLDPIAYRTTVTEAAMPIMDAA